MLTRDHQKRYSPKRECSTLPYLICISCFIDGDWPSQKFANLSLKIRLVGLQGSDGTHNTGVCDRRKSHHHTVHTIHRYYEVKLLHTNKKWPFCACAQNITKISATYRTYSRMSVIDNIPPHSKLIWDETISRELTWPNIGQRAVWRVEVNEIKTILISISPVNQHYQHHNMSSDKVTQHISDIVFSWLRLLYSHSPAHSSETDVTSDNVTV